MSDLIQKAIDQTERAQFGLCCAEAVHALDIANERIAELKALVKSYQTDGKAMLLEQRETIEQLQAKLDAVLNLPEWSDEGILILYSLTDMREALQEGE